MLSNKLTCPRCGATLRTGNQELTGRRVKCQKCGQKFVAGESTPNGNTPAPGTLELPAVKGPNTARIKAPRTEQIQPAALAAAKALNPVLMSTPFSSPYVRKRGSEARWIVLGLLALLLVGGGVAGTIYLMNGQRPSEEQANLSEKKENSSGSTIDVPPPAGDDENKIKPTGLKEEGGPDKNKPEENPEGNPAGPSAKGNVNDYLENELVKGEKPLNNVEYQVPEQPTAKLFSPEETLNLKKPGEDDYRTGLTPENQKRVNDAIERGIKFLMTHQLADGTWGKTYPIGYAALPALTLLECGIPPEDPVIQKAAQFVRKNSVKLTHTYQMSLAILFLDRLGDKQDHDLIRSLATRLVAGQTAAGGWNYTCPMLTLPQENELVAFLKETRPTPLIPLTKGGDDSLIPVGKDNPTPAPKKPDGKGGVVLLFQPGEEELVFKPFAINKLSAKLQDLPVVQQQPVGKPADRKKGALKSGRDDNSNTQFAIMALWVARKYNVPMERTMALVDQRFLTSQTASGGWGYQYGGGGVTPQMTCVGLIGLAMGHGSHKEALGDAWKKQAGAKVQGDPAIQKGLSLLSKYVGQSPQDWNKSLNLSNLYFLWSVERVAMLYNLKTVGGKDWYNWAAHQLVTNQKMDGSWSAKNYHGSSPVLDTSLSLLILKRANLVQDLTRSLQEYIPIKDPG